MRRSLRPADALASPGKSPDDSEERKGVYRLRVTLRLGGALSDAQRQELLAVASKCPVHKLMTQATTEVTTELAPAAA